MYHGSGPEPGERGPREQFFRVPSDGSQVIVQPQFPRGLAKSVAIVNGSANTLLMTDDEGYVFTMRASAAAVIPVSPSTRWRLKLSSADTVGTAVYGYFFDSLANPGALTGASSGLIEGNVASGAADSGNPVKIGGVYETALPTLANGERGDAQSDVNAVLLVDPLKIAGEDLTNDVLKVEQRYSYASISTAATTTVKSGAGFLHTLNVLGGTLGAITVYDNTAGSGTVIIATFTPTAAGSFVLDVSFGTGLTIVTAAATVITVSYR